MIYVIERYIYFLTSIFFLFIPVLYPLGNSDINILLSVSLSLIYIYHFVISRLKTPMNTIFSNRMFKSSYAVPTTKPKTKAKVVNRRGDIIVLTIYFLYVFTVFLCAYFRILITWNILMSGVLFLLGLNNIFKYEVCLIKLWIYKDVNCCMDCHINGWDDMLIFSILPIIFMVYNSLSIFNCILIGIIIWSSVFGLVLWEGGLYFFPERFFPETNAQLCCDNCIKRKCVGRIKKKYQSTHMKYCFPIDQHKTLFSVYQKHYVTYTLLFNFFLLICVIGLVGINYFFEYFLFFLIVCSVISWNIIYKWIKKEYRNLFWHHIAPIIKWSRQYGDNKKAIYDSFEKGMFEISSIRNVIIYTGAIAFWMIFLCDLVVENRINLPQNISDVRILITFIILAFNIIVGCRAFVIFYNAYKQFSYIVSLPILTDYYSDGYIHIREIRRFCNTSVLIISLVCMLIVVAFTYGPINYSEHFRIFTILVLFLVTLCPIVIYVVVQRYLGIISNKMKIKTVKLHNLERYTYKETSKQDIEFYKTLLEIKESSKTDKDYTAIFTFISGLIQLAIILIENK